MTEIIGIFLLRNEDVFVERSLRNVVEFCDRIVVAENYSNDDTWSILQSLSKEYAKLEIHRIRHPRESHDLIADFAGRDVWLFGVDGDEIYDPEGLKRFRRKLLSGDYDEWWNIFGNVLNVTEFDPSRKIASGYLAPPSRSVTKLYNFSVLKSWDGPCPERLHGGTPVFQQGYGTGHRLDLHQNISWSTADLRCIHACFIPRSSKEMSIKGRINPAELNAQSWAERIGYRLFKLARKDPKSDWKRQKYMRGDKVTLDVSAFFPDR